MSVRLRRLAVLLVLPVLAQCRATVDADTSAPARTDAATAPSSEYEIPADAEWIQLFDGRTLDGWVPKIQGHPLGENVLDTFRVEDGKLCVRYDRYVDWGDRFGHLFHVVPFSNYVLRAKYRFVGEQVPGGPGWAWRNNGLMIHGQDPSTMRLDQSFPVSIEVQLLGGAAEGERTNGNVCTPGTNVVMDGELDRRHCISSNSETYRDDEWVEIEVVVHGSREIVHRLGGRDVLRYEQPQLDPDDPDAARLLANGADLLLSSGTISIQSESAPIEFERIEILPLGTH
ncbi:MAG: DUF1080 domain-containing protein [Planctomycetota bacterium]